MEPDCRSVDLPDRSRLDDGDSPRDQTKSRVLVILHKGWDGSDPDGELDNNIIGETSQKVETVLKYS
jgi:hypothetical protein